MAVTIMPIARWGAVVLALVLVALALRGFMRLRATTLAAPCLWVALSACCLAGGAFLGTQLDGMSLSALRFAAAATTLCPLMAVLGAKRPQDRGWQWVVLTLWIVLVWPAAQAALLPAGIQLELFVAWKLFLWGLIGAGLLNYLPTRHWPSALLVALGQFLLLHEHLWLPAAESPALNQLIAMLSFVVATLVASRRPAANDAGNSEFATHNSAWLSFRDGYGAFWALRILGRANHTAELRDWPLRLNWSGFALTTDQQPSESQLAELDQTMDSMLRRFVADNDD